VGFRVFERPFIIIIAICFFLHRVSTAQGIEVHLPVRVSFSKSHQPLKNSGFSVCLMQFLSIVCALERTNQLNLLPDKDLVDLCPYIEPYQVPKSQNSSRKTFHD